MTINPEEIHDQYRNADLTDRLNIYLQFPELRDDFFEIEQKEKKTVFFETAKPQAKVIDQINRWISRRFSFL